MSKSSSQKLPNRRIVLSALAATPLLAAAKAVSAQSSPFVQVERAGGDGFMKVAADMLSQALDAGDQPFGAVVVKNGKIVR